MSLTALAFAVSFLVGCAMALARHPIFGLVTYVAVFYLHPPSRWWGQGVLLEIRWSLIASVVTLFALWLHRKKGALQPMPKALIYGTLAFVVWMLIQFPWAMNPDLHWDLITLFAKYAVLVWVIYRCVDTERHLKMFLWAHVLGCFYLGWVVFSTYIGGRFEGFGGPGIQEANAGAMQLVTGTFTAAALFLNGNWRIRAILVGVIPFILNGIVSTISRSATLATFVGGLVFNLFTPLRFRWVVSGLSVLAAVLFVLLTNDVYWERIESLKYKGAEVEGVDTGAGRLDIIRAQWLMFEAHPLGCGHRCTVNLSRSYLPPEALTGVPGGPMGRSSHNSLMTMLVEHGVPGGILYFAMLVWTAFMVVRVHFMTRRSDGFLAQLTPAVAAILAAIAVGDQFVDYQKLEVRFWFMTILLCMVRLVADESRGRSVARPSDRRAIDVTSVRI